MFPTNIVQTGIASATFTLQNPFTASINIREVTANVTYRDLYVGKPEISLTHASFNVQLGIIDHQSIPVHADGHSTVTSPSIPFKFNLDPVTIINLINDNAQANGISLGPLTALFQVVLQDPTAKNSIVSSIDPNANNPTCVRFVISHLIIGCVAYVYIQRATVRCILGHSQCFERSKGRSSIGYIFGFRRL